MDTFEDLKSKYLNFQRTRTKKEKKTPVRPRKLLKEHLVLPPPQILPTNHLDDPDFSPLEECRYGCYIELCEKINFESAAKYTKQIGCNCLAAAARLRYKPDPDDILKCKKYISDNDIELWVRLPMTINFCRKCCESTKLMRSRTMDHVKSAITMGAKGCIINAGSIYTKESLLSVDFALSNFKQNIEETIEVLLKEGFTKIPWLLIESSSGKDYEFLEDIELLSKLYFSINKYYRKYVGFCVDTSRIFASGIFDFRLIEDIDEFIECWNEHIGWEHTKLVHISDNEHRFDSAEVNPVVVGEGKIGKKGLKYFKNFCILTGKSVVTKF